MDIKIGVYVCECGPNISEKIDIDRVIKTISSDKNIYIIEKFKLLCSADGKKFLEEEIKKQGLTHLVIAACSPKEHENPIELRNTDTINNYIELLKEISLDSEDKIAKIATDLINQLNSL